MFSIFIYYKNKKEENLSKTVFGENIEVPIQPRLLLKRVSEPKVYIIQLEMKLSIDPSWLQYIIGRQPRVTSIFLSETFVRR